MVHGVWDVFSEFQFRFRVSVGGANGFPLRAESVGVLFARCSSSGNVLSIFLKVSRRFVVAVSIHGVCFFFLGLGLVQVDFPLVQGV